MVYCTGKTFIRSRGECNVNTDKKYSIHDIKFRRKFSVNPFNTLKMKLGEMSFWKDWINTTRGDPYPVLLNSGSLREETGNGRIRIDNVSGSSASKARLLGQHFPYAFYELTINTLENASAGFMLSANNGEYSSYTKEDAPVLRVSIVHSKDEANIKIAHELTVGGIVKKSVVEETEYPYVRGMSLILACRGKFFDIYIRSDKKTEPCLTLDIPEFSDIVKHGTFVNSASALWYCVEPGGSFVAEDVEFYLSAGISHADMRPIRYEDGTPIITEGNLFMTMSSRLEAGGYQSVISWNPSTAEFKLEGAIFFDCGDDRWCSDVASSILYNRPTNEWYIWGVSFSHGHILFHGKSGSDVRYGITVIDAELMTAQKTDNDTADALAIQAGVSASVNATLSDDTLWAAKSGDEDPDFVYDRESEKWYMTICRLVNEPSGNHYRYFLYESDKPFEGYRFVDKTLDGENTGGSIVRIGGKLHFICGSNFQVRSQYNIYDLPDMSKYFPIRCDYDDGGFRGWGTVIPVPCGNRVKYMWMTFDRHCGSSYNWSYGNIYVYESDVMNTNKKD